MSPVAETIIQRLDAARQKWWLFTLLTTTIMAACLSFGTLQVFVLADAFFRLSQVALLIVFLAWLGLTATLLVVVGRRLVRSQRSLEATARRIEAEFPELGSSLINLVQLSEETCSGNPQFCEAAVNEAAARVGYVRLEDAASQEPRWRRLLHCMQTPRDLAESLVALGLLTLIAIVCQMFIANWSSAASRLMAPWAFIPSIGSVGKIEVIPGDSEIIIGSSLQVSGRIENPEKRPYEATLFVTPEGEDETARPMSPDKDQKQYALVLPSVGKPLTYRLEIGDSQSPVYRVRVCEKPTVAEITVRYDYPAYLHRTSETRVQKQADLEGPQYSVAELRVRPSTPISKGHIQWGGQQLAGRVEDGGMLLVASLPLLKNGTYTIHLYNGDHTDPNPRVNAIRVRPDDPPSVELLKPPRQSNSAPGADVAVTIRAIDDCGLGLLRLESKLKASQGPAAPDLADPTSATAPTDSPSADQEPGKVIQQWSDLGGSTTAARQYTLRLDPAELKPGQTLLIRAVARDQRSVTDWGLKLQRQEACSPWHAIQIASPQTNAAATLQQLENLRTAIWRLLEKQIHTRVRTAGILKSADLAQRDNACGEIRTSQVDLQKATTALAASIGPTGHEDRTVIKRILSQLATGDMLEAVRQSDTLLKLKTPNAFDQPTAALLDTQARIVEVLRKLLDAARQAQSEVLAEMPKRPGSDLPDDTQKKLEEARKKLDEFLAQQKKVIEATENLAKKPVEDFSEEDKQKLHELAAIEDDWAKFMKELHSDLSKLPEQDFANSSMASELVEIQTEIKMAEDALLKQTADIAVPLEQLGYEMAEELKTNLEKWLPDTPDRERWSQEESLSDKDKEAPMAELPGELEDLVGDLMEQEEDLFDEMDDISSSAADSLDKGAGWDAMDGPISNMSAKGVTGNRLPNTSEIGGRSGEGRSGKSAGEFVGDEAVGKGGRKTPSRLTPDPYMKGQVKDHSVDPSGGATGGGKESGQGGEGLEGPLPRSPGPRDLERLAGKQAALRNKAEGIDLQFQVMNFHRTDLKKLIDLMSQVERDLKAGRYQNALRQRKVLADGLGNVKQYLQGEFEVRQDSTSNLPGDIQKQLLGSMLDPSPAGWEELNRQYFQRLSGTTEKTTKEAPASK